MSAFVTPSTKTVRQTDNELQPPIYSSEAYGWKNILVEEFCQPPGQEKYQNLIEHTLCLSLNRRPSRLSQAIDTRRYSSLFTKGDLSIAPAGSLLLWQWNEDDQYLRIRIASQFLEQVAHETDEISHDRVELLPEFRTQNPQIEQIGMMLLAELKNEGLAGRLYVESLTNVLAVHLLRNYSTVQTCVTRYDAELSDRQLLQVTDYISDRLADEIKLSDLAQLLGISQFHFSRLFKRSVGVPPHQYLLQQRLERAKHLLKHTELSVMEIALLCGFSSHSHLGKWFRRYTGMPPKAYRVR